MNTQHNKRGQPANMPGLKGKLCKPVKHRIVRCLSGLRSQTGEQPESLKVKVLRVSDIKSGMGESGLNSAITGVRNLSVHY